MKDPSDLHKFLDSYDLPFHMDEELEQYSWELLMKSIKLMMFLTSLGT